MKVAPATPADAPAMASAHAQAFDTPWDEESFEDLLEGAGIYGFVAEGDDPMGLILCRIAGGQVEVLTLAVPPWARRRGVAQALIAAALVFAREQGARACFLEVDVANRPAIGLYERLGFAEAGLRRGYYDRGSAGRADALVMRLDLGSRRR